MRVASVMCVFLSSILSVSVFAGTVYEANPGDDIKAMAANLVPGDTLQLHGGTYDTPGFWLGNKAGTAALPIVIEAYPGEKPVLNCTDLTRNCIDISNCSYLTLRGLEVKGSGGNGVKSAAYTVNDHITIEYVPARTFTPEYLSEFNSRLAGHLPQDLKFCLKKVEAVRRTNAGKIKPVVSLIKKSPT